MSLKPYKYAIFDFDGTIVDTESVFSWFDQGILNYWLKKIGRPEQLTREDARALAGNGAVRKWELMGERFGFDAALYVDDFITYRNGKRVNLFIDHPPARAKGLEALFEAVGPNKALATNKSGEKLALDLPVMKLDKTFDHIVSCDPPFVRKPDPGLLLAAAEKLGAAPEDCLYVGDNVIDVQASMNAGMASVSMIIEGFEGQEERIEALKDAGTQMVIEDMTDLIPYYDPS